MTETAVTVRMTNPSDIASSVPYLLGFVPQESVVVVTVSGKRKRVGLTLRFDLLEASHDQEVARALAAAVRRERPREAYVLIFTESPDEAGDLPRRPLFTAVKRALGVPVVDGLLVRTGRWWSYACGDPRCCPPDGGLIDTSSPQATSLAAAHALHGHGVLPSRDALVDSIKPLGGITRESMEQAFDRATARIVAERRDGLRERVTELVDELLVRYRDPRAVLDHDEAAYLLLATCDISIRDDVLMRCGDDDQLDVLHRLLVDLARRSVPEVAASAWSMLAWASYAKGIGVLAAAAVERALAADPDYSLAQLIEDALAHQIRPDLLREVSRGPGGRDTAG